jgi:hypothetical protein
MIHACTVKRMLALFDRSQLARMEIPTTRFFKSARRERHIIWKAWLF